MNITFGEGVAEFGLYIGWYVQKGGAKVIFDA
jgi:hypothetical protein